MTKPLALKRPERAQKVYKKIYTFWAYSPGDQEERLYVLPSRQEAEIAQDEIGCKTRIREEWVTEYSQRNPCS